MNTHNIRFHEEIRKILFGYPLLSGAMVIRALTSEKVPLACAPSKDSD